MEKMCWRFARRIIHEKPKDETDAQAVRRAYAMAKALTQYCVCIDRPEHINPPKPKPIEASLAD